MACRTNAYCMHMCLISILLLSSTLVPAGSASTPTYRIELTHVDANGGFTREELLQRAEDRAELTAALLSNTDAKYKTSAQYSPYVYEYLMELEIGESRQSFKAVADTGSEMVWTKKLGNCRCDASSTFTRWSCSHPDVMSPGEAAPKLVPCECGASTAGSCCSKDGPCMFTKSYGSGSASGFMATENLTLPGKDPIRARLGCAIDRGNKMLLPPSADGVVGLNSGKDSLVRQLGVEKFAYCLSNSTAETAPPSQLLFGGQLELRAADGMPSLQTTPLVGALNAEGERVGNLKYYVQLDGISIGTDEMHEPVPKESFNLKSDKDGNKGVMFIDSGASITYLEKSVFELLLKLLNMEEKVRVDDGNNSENGKNKKKKYYYRLADAGSEGPHPQLVLHFLQAKMHLPWDNYMAETKVGSGLFCLKIGEHEEHEEHSVLGNFQQQNMHMLFNLTEDNKELHFALHKDCSDL